jgi:hypothetical protein
MSLTNGVAALEQSVPCGAWRFCEEDEGPLYLYPFSKVLNVFLLNVFRVLQ